MADSLSHADIIHLKMLEDKVQNQKQQVQAIMEKLRTLDMIPVLRSEIRATLSRMQAEMQVSLRQISELLHQHYNLEVPDEVAADHSIPLDSYSDKSKSKLGKNGDRSKITKSKKICLIVEPSAMLDMAPFILAPNDWSVGGVPKVFEEMRPRVKMKKNFAAIMTVQFKQRAQFEFRYKATGDTEGVMVLWWKLLQRRREGIQPQQLAISLLSSAMKNKKEILSIDGRQGAKGSQFQVHDQSSEKFILKVPSNNNAKEDVLNCLFKFFNGVWHQHRLLANGVTFDALVKVLLMILNVDFLEQYVADRFVHHKFTHDSIIESEYMVAYKSLIALQLLDRMRFGGLELDYWSFKVLLSFLLWQHCFEVAIAIYCWVLVANFQKDVTQLVMVGVVLDSCDSGSGFGLSPYSIVDYCLMNSLLGSGSADEYRGWRNPIGQGRFPCRSTIVIIFNTLCKNRKLDKMVIASKFNDRHSSDFTTDGRELMLVEKVTENTMDIKQVLVGDFGVEIVFETINTYMFLIIEGLNHLNGLFPVKEKVYPSFDFASLIAMATPTIPVSKSTHRLHLRIVFGFGTTWPPSFFMFHSGIIASVILKGLSTQGLLRCCFKVEFRASINLATSGDGFLLCWWIYTLGTLLIRAILIKKATQLQDGGCPHSLDMLREEPGCFSNVELETNSAVARLMFSIHSDVNGANYAHQCMATVQQNNWQVWRTSIMNSLCAGDILGFFRVHQLNKWTNFVLPAKAHLLELIMAHKGVIVGRSVMLYSAPRRRKSMRNSAGAVESDFTKEIQGIVSLLLVDMAMDTFQEAKREHIERINEISFLWTEVADINVLKAKELDPNKGGYKGSVDGFTAGFFEECNSCNTKDISLASQVNVAENWKMSRLDFIDRTHSNSSMYVKANPPDASSFLLVFFSSSKPLLGILIFSWAQVFVMIAIDAKIVLNSAAALSDVTMGQKLLLNASFPHSISDFV